MAKEPQYLPEAYPEQSSDLLEVKTVGPNTISAISIMGEKEALAGNVLRRLCKLGGEACAKTCALHQGIVARAEANIEAKCADDNLMQVISELGTNPENVFMVGVTADGVGFADEVDNNKEKYPYKINENTSIKELPGFNAFYAREGDKIGGDEVVALGRRLADCGDVNMEFTDNDGNKVMGFMHMTRPNLQGAETLKYDYKGKKIGSFEYFLNSAMDHYQADISDVTIRIAAAIKPEHFIYKFTDENQMEEPLPGWKNMIDETGKPFLINRNNPKWNIGDTFNPEDEWEVDFQAMLRWQIVQVEGLSSSQINWEGVIDPGEADSQHASNERGKTNSNANGRDAYFTAWQAKLTA
jgi:hypothetical protein